MRLVFAILLSTCHPLYCVDGVNVENPRPISGISVIQPGIFVVFSIEDCIVAFSDFFGKYAYLEKPANGREKKIFEAMERDGPLFDAEIRCGSIKPELVLCKSRDHYLVISMSLGSVLEFDGKVVRHGALNPGITERLKLIWFDRINSIDQNNDMNR